MCAKVRVAKKATRVKLKNITVVAIWEKKNVGGGESLKEGF